MIRLLACLLLVLGHLGAEPPAIGVQVGWSRLRPATVDLAAASGNLVMEGVHQRAPVLRGFLTGQPLPGWGLEASLGWRGRSRGDLRFHSDKAGSGTLDATLVLRTQTFLGGLLCREIPAGLGIWSAGFGLDLRSERLALESSSGASAAQLTRPWLRAVLRRSGGGPGRWYAALEFAAPLSRSSISAVDYLRDLDLLDSTTNTSAGAAAKAHAPGAEWTLAVGLRLPR